MRAVVLHRKRTVAIENVPDPELTAPTASSFAWSTRRSADQTLHLYHGDIEATGVRLGHEFIGTVAEAGPEVRTLRVGDRGVGLRG